MVYSLQGCNPGGDDDEAEPSEISWLLVAYTIMTYTEGSRLVATLLIGILIGSMCRRCREPIKTTRPTKPVEDK